MAPSTLCPPQAAACAARSVTTTGGGCGGIEVRLGCAAESHAHACPAGWPCGLRAHLTPPPSEVLAFCNLDVPSGAQALLVPLLQCPRGWGPPWACISLRHCGPDPFPESSSLTGWASSPAGSPQHDCCLSSVAGGWETQYMCCSAAVGSVGCQVAKVSPAVCHSLLLVTALAFRDTVESHVAPASPSWLTQAPAPRP